MYQDMALIPSYVLKPPTVSCSSHYSHPKEPPNESFTIYNILGVVTAVNCINVKLAARGQTFTTCTSILSLILITILGFVHMAKEGKLHKYPVSNTLGFVECLDLFTSEMQVQFFYRQQTKLGPR